MSYFEYFANNLRKVIQNFLWSDLKLTNSKEIMKKEKEYYVQAYAKKPLVLVEGKDTIVRDAEGKEYIDCLSGISVVNAVHYTKCLGGIT